MALTAHNPNLFFEDFNEDGVFFHKDFSKFKNLIRSIRNKSFDVEVVIFDDNLLYLAIRTKKHDKLVEIIDKYFKFEEEKWT